MRLTLLVPFDLGRLHGMTLEIEREVMPISRTSITRLGLLIGQFLDRFYRAHSVRTSIPVAFLRCYRSSDDGDRANRTAYGVGHDAFGSNHTEACTAPTFPQRKSYTENQYSLKGGVKTIRSSLQASRSLWNVQ